MSPNSVCVICSNSAVEEPGLCADCMRMLSSAPLQDQESLLQPELTQLDVPAHLLHPDFNLTADAAQLLLQEPGIPFSNVSVPSDELTCQQCGKRFRSLSRLQQHKITHIPNAPRPFHCPVVNCHRTFTLESYLKQHMKRSHTGGVQCDVCGKQLKHRQSLQRHLQQRHSQQQLQCAFCDRSYGYRSDLKRHIQQQHSNTQTVLTCPVSGCAVLFSGKAAQRQHVRKQHSLDPDMLMTNG